MQPVGSAGCFSLAKPPAKPTSRNDADVKFKSLGWIEIKRYIVAFAEKIQGNAQSPTHRRGNHREDPGQCAFSNSSPCSGRTGNFQTRLDPLLPEPLILYHKLHGVIKFTVPKLFQTGFKKPK